MKTNIKMRVTPEQNEKVQEIVFANGGGWRGKFSSQEIINTSFSYVFIDEEKKLTCAGYFRTFCEVAREEVCADLFIRTNGTCEEQEPRTSKYPHFEKMLNNMNENFAEAIKMVEESEKQELENAKYKVGDYLKGDEKHNDFFIKILEVKYSLESEQIVYLVKNVKDEKQYSFGERHLYNHFKLQKNENSKYKVGDILKGASGEYKGVYIEIEDTHKCIAGTGFFYLVKNVSNEGHYAFSEKYLDKHFELQKFENKPIKTETLEEDKNEAFFKKFRQTNAINPNHYNQMKIQPNEYITANYDCFSWNTANVNQVCFKIQK